MRDLHSFTYILYIVPIVLSFTRGAILFPASQYPPQGVAAVDVSSENESTDPTGMMMMPANLVKVFTDERTEQVKRLREGVACLEAAMAERRETGRTETLQYPRNQL